jgi:predicted Zn-dependent protease
MSIMNQKLHDEKGEARKRLDELVQREPKNELAWLQLSEFVELQNEAIDCLQHVLTINPGNTAVKARLDQLVRAENKTQHNKNQPEIDNQQVSDNSSGRGASGSIVSDMLLPLFLDIVFSFILSILFPSS